MRIVVNLRQYYKGKIGGMENYVRNILSRLDSELLTIFVQAEESAHVHEFAPKAELIKIGHENAVAKMVETLTQRDFDLFFCPLLVLEPVFVNIPSAVMMPDVQHEFYPDFFDEAVLNWRNQTYRPTAAHADVLFTLSEDAKLTIMDKYGAAADRIEVIPLDVDEEFRRPPAPPTRQFSALRLAEDYFYFPANYWPHKNHANVLKAFQMLTKTHPEVHLVLTGAPSTGAEAIEKMAATLGLKDRVRMLGHVPREVVVDLYRNARALLFATKFEGFGIPLLEAFHSRIPVIASNLGSTLEVAGEAALLVDPLDPESIAEGMRAVLEDQPLREALIEKGRARADAFSWDIAYQKTKAAFNRITSPDFVRRPVITIKEWPKFGIVTPTYNMGQYLEETIESILSQDYPHLDYVVMDGGSKDNTVEILKKYEGRLRWKSEKDKGQGDAVNKGWHATTGGIFTFLNADDTYLPGALASIAKHFRDKPNAGLIYGEAYHVHQDGKVIDRYPTNPFDLETLSEQCYICQPAAFMNYDAFGAAGMINTQLHFALDYELWMRIARLYPVYKVDDYLATSRMYMDNKTLANRRRVYQEILSSVKAHYGYVPFQWVNGYACYLVDRKDQFFDRSKPTLISHGLGLALGSYYNRRNVGRYLNEWRKSTGVFGSFDGRWDDGWISKCYQRPIAVSKSAKRLRITGQHNAPLRLRLTVKLNGAVLKQSSLAPGPFDLAMDCPDSARGQRCRLEIEANGTWRPSSEDRRKLSCIIDRIEMEPAEIV